MWQSPFDIGGNSEKNRRQSPFRQGQLDGIITLNWHAGDYRQSYPGMQKGGMA